MANRSTRREHLVIADTEPLDVDGIRTVGVGTLGWLIAFLVLLPFSGTLADQHRLWWLWTCVAGVMLGLVGLAYCRRRRSRLAVRTAPRRRS